MSEDPWPEVTAAEAIAARGIADEAEYEAVLKRIDELLDQLDGSVVGPRDLELEALLKAVMAYEDAEVPLGNG